MALKFSKLFFAGVFIAAAGTAQAQDFDGGYAGVNGRVNVNSPFGGIDIAAGGFAGYNFALGSGAVAGIEGDADYDWVSVWGGSDLTMTANGRVGYDVGGALVYGKLGAGYSTTGSAVWDVGAGADIPVADTYFIRTEIERVDPFAAGLSTRYNLNAGLGMQF